MGQGEAPRAPRLTSTPLGGGGVAGVARQVVEVGQICSAQYLGEQAERSMIGGKMWRHIGRRDQSAANRHHEIINTTQRSAGAWPAPGRTQ